MKNPIKFVSKYTTITIFASLFFTPVVAYSDFVESGFLEDYAILTQDPERPSVRVYFAPGASLDQYDKILLTDIVLFMHPESEYKGVSGRKIVAITGEFQTFLEENLATKRELVSEIFPGDKVVVIRLAISNVYAKRPRRGVIGFTPIGVAKTGVKKAAGSDYVLSTAALEGEVLDGQTGELLGAVVATQLGETLAKAKSGERKWSDIQAYLRDYADTLRDRFN